MNVRQSGPVIPKSQTAMNTVLLGELIKSNYADQDLELPTLVFIARSGLEIAGTLTRHLNVGAAGFFMAGVERNDSEEEQEVPRFKIGQFPVKSQIEDSHILAIDVVCRSGSKLKFVTQTLKDLGAISAKSAVLYDMTGSPKQDPSLYKPDYFVVDGHSMGYITFDWELEEHIAENEMVRKKQV